MTLAMTLTRLLGVSLLLACVSAQNFADYDYQDTLGPQAPQRVAPRPQHQQGPSRPAAFNNGYTTSTIRPTPVPILKQINKHNDDGSYTYGYEGADGSFKIETKLPTGEVMGKYGYVDDQGKVRTVEYGANRYGFQPAGTGITVPPPTLVDETTCGPNSAECQEEQQQFQQQQPQRPAPRPKAVARPRPRPQPQPQPQFDYDDAYAAPVARPQQQQYSPGPAPPRSVVPGAAPAFAPSAAPVPPRLSIPGAAPSGPVYRAPQQQFQQAPPSFPAPQVHRPAPVRENQQARPASRGLNLDSLAQQYALPRGSSNPTHDISFGSYSSQTQF